MIIDEQHRFHLLGKRHWSNQRARDEAQRSIYIRGFPVDTQEKDIQDVLSVFGAIHKTIISPKVNITYMLTTPSYPSSPPPSYPSPPPPSYPSSPPPSYPSSPPPSYPSSPPPSYPSSPPSYPSSPPPSYPSSPPPSSPPSYPSSPPSSSPPSYPSSPPPFIFLHFFSI